MTRTPDFRELVDTDDLDGEEWLQLRDVHDLLVAAGPPPEPVLRPGASRRVRAARLARRRPAAALLVAAAVAAAAFAGGYAVGDQTSRPAASAWASTIVMRGQSGHLASLRVARPDAAGNRSILLRVRGLPQLPPGGYYELLLTRNGELGPECGSFAVSGKTTTVAMTIAYQLRHWTGWVIVRHLPGQPESAPILST